MPHHVHPQHACGEVEEGPACVVPPLQVDLAGLEVRTRLVELCKE